MSSQPTGARPSGEDRTVLDSVARRELVEAGGGLFQAFGLPRSTGQIYGLLYLSEGPLSLDDMVRFLSISKGSASIGTRYLAGLGVIRQVWIPGDRRDHFEAVGDLGELLRAAFGDFLKPRLASSERRLAKIVDALEDDFERGAISKTSYKFCSERLRMLLRYQKKVQSFGPLAEKLLL